MHSLKKYFSSHQTTVFFLHFMVIFQQNQFGWERIGYNIIAEIAIQLFKRKEVYNISNYKILMPS
jgi:hypothetical protein